MPSQKKERKAKEYNLLSSESDDISMTSICFSCLSGTISRGIGKKGTQHVIEIEVLHNTEP